MSNLLSPIEVSYTELDRLERYALSGGYGNTDRIFVVSDEYGRYGCGHSAMMIVVMAPLTKAWTVRQLIRPPDIENSEIVSHARARRWTNNHVNKWIGDTCWLLMESRVKYKGSSLRASDGSAAS